MPCMVEPMHGGYVAEGISGSTYSRDLPPAGCRMLPAAHFDTEARVPTPMTLDSFRIAIFAALAFASGFSLAVAGTDGPATRVLSVPASSMLPTLLDGELILADLEAYRSREPERGDVIIFLSPRDKSLWLKRLVGLPGDRVQMIDGMLFINDKPVPREQVADYVGVDRQGDPVEMRRYRETLPGGREYETLDNKVDTALENTEIHLVPFEHYFVLGDNRNQSLDSRLPASEHGLGDVPRQNIIGEAKKIVWSRDTSRIGTVIP